MCLPIILAAIINGFNGHRRRCDRQLARIECLGRVVCGNILTSCIHDRVSLCKCTSILGYILTLRRGVGDCQDIVFAKAFDRIIIGLDRFAGSGNSGYERTAFLFLTIVNLLNILNRY